MDEAKKKEREREKVAINLAENRVEEGKKVVFFLSQRNLYF